MAKALQPRVPARRATEGPIGACLTWRQSPELIAGRRRFRDIRSVDLFCDAGVISD
jgi:hypothetical protein